VSHEYFPSVFNYQAFGLCLCHFGKYLCPIPSLSIPLIEAERKNLKWNMPRFNSLPGQKSNNLLFLRVYLNDRNADWRSVDYIVTSAQITLLTQKMVDGARAAPK